MKRSALLKFFIVAVALSVTAVGCKRGPKSLTYIPGQSGGPGVGGATDLPPSNPLGDSPVTGEGIGAADRSTAEWLLQNGVQDRSQFATQTVYFDFDSSVVKPGDVGKVETVAGYLNSNRDQAVIIEGHCDERGTEEYNRALGERRAMAVREVLVRLGVDANRVHTVSYGEDVPAVEGRNEAAWIKNRRGEFVLLRPKS